MLHQRLWDRLWGSISESISSLRLFLWGCSSIKKVLQFFIRLNVFEIEAKKIKNFRSRLIKFKNSFDSELQKSMKKKLKVLIFWWMVRITLFPKIIVIYLLVIRRNGLIMVHRKYLHNEFIKSNVKNFTHDFSTVL